MTDTSFVPGTVKPEEDYEELMELGRELGIPVPQQFITLELRDPDGKLLDERTQRSRTWNRNFWNVLTCTASSAFSQPNTTFGAGYLCVTSVAGSKFAVPSGSSSLGAQSPFGNISSGNENGIVVGTGSAAESFEGTSLSSVVTHGTGAGQLSYSTYSPWDTPTQAYTAGTKTWTSVTARTFTNSSAGSIVVTETGMYKNAAGWVYMATRDLLGASITVLSGGYTLTVAYTTSLGFPA